MKKIIILITLIFMGCLNTNFDVPTEAVTHENLSTQYEKDTKIAESKYKVYEEYGKKLKLELRAIKIIYQTLVDIILQRIF